MQPKQNRTWTKFILKEYQIKKSTCMIRFQSWPMFDELWWKWDAAELRIYYTYYYLLQWDLVGLTLIDHASFHNIIYGPFFLHLIWQTTVYKSNIYYPSSEFIHWTLIANPNLVGDSLNDGFQNSENPVFTSVGRCFIGDHQTCWMFRSWYDIDSMDQLL